MSAMLRFFAMPWRLAAQIIGVLAGPVLFYDLVRSARGGRHVLFRTLFASSLLLLLYLLYRDLNPSPQTTSVHWQLWFGSRALMDQELRPDVSRLAAGFFEKFIFAQLIVIVLLTPACVATAIAEEKERRTLEDLLVTELRSHDLVFGKLISRLAYLMLILLAGLPVLSLLQLLGGIDPNLVLAGYSLTALTLLSVAGLSLLNSVLFRKPITAVLVTYVALAAYLFMCWWLPTSWLAASMSLPAWLEGGNVFVAMSKALGAAEETLSQVISQPGQVTLIYGSGSQAIRAQSFAYSGSPNTMIVTSGSRFLYGGPPTTIAFVPPDYLSIVGHYAIFHGLLVLICLFLAVLLMRPLAIRQLLGRGQRAFVVGRIWDQRRPAVSNRPMLWKELYAEPLWRMNRLGLSIFGAIFMAFLLLGAFGFLTLFLFGRAHGDIASWMNWGVCMIGTPIACLMLLGVALRAASSWRSEIDRDTLDSLLSTSFSAHTILNAKWLGSLLCTRSGWWILGAIWIIGILTGGLDAMAAVCLFLCWWVYALFFASLGVCISVSCKTQLRAVVCVIVIFLGLNYGFLQGLYSVLNPDMLGCRVGDDNALSWAFVEAMAPVHNLWTFANYKHSEFYAFPDWPRIILAPLLVYLLLSVLFLYASHAEFLRVYKGRLLEHPSIAE